MNLPKTPKAVLLCTDGASTRAVFHALSAVVDWQAVLIEPAVPHTQLLKRRLRTLGWLTVFGQVAFMGLNAVLKRFGKHHYNALVQQLGLQLQGMPQQVCQFVPSANSPETLQHLKAIAPDVVVVNGTRILSKNVLQSVGAPFINTHTGITPRYRGVHGGYWALAQRDAAHCGVTVHLVDTGIDTGGVLYQALIHPQAGDSFNTYPLHQTVAALPLLRQAIADIQNGRLNVLNTTQAPSRLWSHPTLWGYVWTWLRHRVR